MIYCQPGIYDAIWEWSCMEVLFFLQILNQLRKKRDMTGYKWQDVYYTQRNWFREGGWKGERIWRKLSGSLLASSLTLIWTSCFSPFVGGYREQKGVNCKGFMKQLGKLFSYQCEETLCHDKEQGPLKSFLLLPLWETIHFL